MAESIPFSPAKARTRPVETERELARLEGRLAEINGLLDTLYESGVIRWLKDLSGALPQVSAIAAERMNTREGHASLRNLTIMAEQLGRIDPDRLEQIMDTAHTAIRHASRPAEEDTHEPPGVTGVFKLLHDKQLWATLGPALEGLRAYSQARASDKPDRQDDR